MQPQSLRHRSTPCAQLHEDGDDQLDFPGRWMVREPCAQVRDVDLLGSKLARRPSQSHLTELVMMAVGLAVGDERDQLVVASGCQGGANRARRRSPRRSAGPRTRLPRDSGPCPNTTVIDSPPGNETK